jgi:hypothetical protein
MSSDQAKSAVVSVSTPGVLPTGIPFSVAVLTSILSKPTAIWLITLSWFEAPASMTLVFIVSVRRVNNPST